MAQSSESIAHEAKGIQTALKELRQSRDPWDRDVEFQRKRLRRLYLALLLTHPYERESHDVESHLWMQTSYGLISDYKQLIASSEKPPESPHSHQPRANNGQNVAENRKTIQRFRQFLAEEERFYMQLVARCRRTFGLDDIHSALVAVNIFPASDNGTQPSAPNGRNHNQFPPEDTVTHVPGNAEQRQGCVGLVSKLLICLGDIARYRELYNESGGRPRAGLEDGPPRRGGRNRRGGLAPSEILAKARNYEKALAYYEQARFMVPNDGHAFHQLAIVASYQRDMYGSLVHYYRALCVSNAYEMALENMGSTFTRSLSQWKAEPEKFKPENVKDSSLPLRIRVDIFEVHMVVLHSFWRIPPAQMDQISPKHPEDAVTMFASLISERVLTIEFISKTIVLTQGALWKHPMIRDRSRGKRAETLLGDDVQRIESRIFSHLLSFHKVLLDEGMAQIEELQPSDSNSDDLAQQITATFRRTLPALRIASKWLRANLKYIQGRNEASVTPFWDSYSAFVRALAKAFPLSKLPSNKAFLEEDIELRGFTPLKGLMGSQSARDSDAMGLHPNVDQLIRIADLLRDAIALAEVPNSPLTSYGGYVFVRDPELEKTPPTRDRPAWPDLFRTPVVDNSDPDDDARTENTDDLLEAAVNHHLDDDDDDDEEIVYNPNPAPAPITPPRTLLPTPSSPDTPSRRGQAHYSPAVTTARDLLNSINISGAPARPPSSQPPLLFGQRSPRSIWSTAEPTVWPERVSPPLHALPPVSQVTSRPVDRFSPQLSHHRRTSYDHPMSGGMPVFPNLASAVQQLQSSPPARTNLPSTFHSTLQPSPPPQPFSVGPVPHPAQYAYNDFVPHHPLPEYGLHYHTRHTSHGG